MKQPKPDKLVVMFGIPMTVHSAGVYPNGSSKCQIISNHVKGRSQYEGKTPK